MDSMEYIYILGWRSPRDQGMTIQTSYDNTDIKLLYNQPMTIHTFNDNTDIKWLYNKITTIHTLNVIQILNIIHLTKYYIFI